MQVIVIQMRRRGVSLRKSMLQDEPGRQGYLNIMETQQNHLHRTAKTARLFSDKQEQQLICSLIEPSLVWANDERFMLSGFEHYVDNGVDIDYAQSWLCLNGWGQSLSDPKALEDHGPNSRRKR